MTHRSPPEHEHKYDYLNPDADTRNTVHPQPSPTTHSTAAPWLTIYEMPDIDYRTTSEFKGLDGQSAPKDARLHEIFEQARFDTRFYAQLSDSSPAKGQTAKYLVSLSTDDPEGVAGLFEGVQGVRRVRAFKVGGPTTVLERFVRRDGDFRGGVVVVEFEGRDGVKDVVEGGLGGRNVEEVGWFERKRLYGDV